MAELNNAWQTASAEMYAQSGAQGAQGAQGGQQSSSQQQGDDVQDAEFEEVK
jgi:molecular chaperone DnaK